VVENALAMDESREHKVELARIAAMLSRLGGRGYCVEEEAKSYALAKFDSDFDPDSVKA